MSAESVNAFISRWSSASPSERANSQLFLTERPSTLDLQPPKAGLCSAGPAVGASKAFVSIVRTDPFSTSCGPDCPSIRAIKHIDLAQGVRWTEDGMYV